jgi:hypothetical protein
MQVALKGEQGHAFVLGLRSCGATIEPGTQALANSSGRTLIACCLSAELSLLRLIRLTHAALPSWLVISQGPSVFPIMDMHIPPIEVAHTLRGGAW